MYYVDLTGSQILLTYSEVYQDEKPDLISEIKKLNMHKAISIICELIRVRDAYLDPIKGTFTEFKFPLELVLKKEMCDIRPKSPKEMLHNHMFKKDVHIISVQMMFMLLKKIIVYGDYNTLSDDNYQITEDDYKIIIKLQLIVAEIVSYKNKNKVDMNHFLYSTYHLNYQRNIANEFLRMYYMLEVISRDRKKFDKDVTTQYKDYYGDFTKKYGFTPTEYSSLLFWQLKDYYSGINGLTYKSFWKNIRKDYGDNLIAEKAEKVIGILSSQISEYKKWAIQSEDREWDFSRFLAFPFFRDYTGNIISLSDITLQNAFFEKLFWLIRDCYPEEKRPMAFFGRLFEKYIQDVTQNATKVRYIYIDEFEFGDKKEPKKSSDAYVRKDNKLLVVEAKGFSVLVDCMTKNERVEDNNKKLFISPILQADLCLSRLEHEQSQLDGVKSSYILSVTMDNINAVPNYYEDIYKEIKDKKQSKTAQYFFNFSIEEYEMLMYLMEQGHDIFEILNEYYNNMKLKLFSTYLLDRYSDIGMTNFMERYYKEASDVMKSILFDEENK